jgi:hypothetical protein
MKYNFSYYQQRIRLRKRDEVLADKVLDFANYGGAALVFGQLVNGQAVRWPGLILGLLIIIVAYYYIWYYLSRFN